MRILHIGDLHFKSNRNNYEQNLMINKMMQNLRSKPHIDMIFFTGDLVFSGSSPKEFEEAHFFLFKRLSDELNVPFENIIICQGNHDINRNETSKAILSYYDEKIEDNDRLNEDYLNPSKDLSNSLKPSENFNEYAKNYFTISPDERTDFYSIHRRNFDGNEIGIVTINSSWLSCGFRWDLNHLMYPVVALKEAFSKIDKIENKLLLIHHPLAYFQEFNAYELEDLIHREFSLMFSGHLHKEQIATKYAGNNGIYANTTQATLTFDKGGEIGFSIINFISKSDEINIERSTYNQKENEFQDLNTVVVHVPCGIEKSNQNKLRRKIVSKLQVELDNADELMLDNSEESKVKFLDMFTHPVISTKSDTENTAPESSATLFSYEDMYRDDKNYLLFGKDKCGKTSLLKRIQIYYLKNYSLLGKTPFYLDYKELEAKNYPIDLKK